MFLLRAGVNRKHRGTGLHRRLLRVREAYGKAARIETAVTYVMADNWVSLANLLKARYVIYEPEYAWAGRDGVYYLQKIL